LPQTDVSLATLDRRFPPRPDDHLSAVVGGHQSCPSAVLYAVCHCNYWTNKAVGGKAYRLGDASRATATDADRFYDNPPYWRHDAINLRRKYHFVAQCSGEAVHFETVIRLHKLAQCMTVKLR
ncbi:MAG: hypothetical protein ACJAUZ_002573, partial [Flavobacteriaceae bacterium]